MQNKTGQEQRRGRLKALLILETIVCYMALLVIVSYIRGPQQYEAAPGGSLLERSDFIPFEGTQAEDGSLRLINTQPGAPVGYAAPIELTGLSRIGIRFRVECPAPYAGGTLLVDLFDFETNYDDVEQEYQHTLLEGTNLVEVSLAPGDDAPGHAQLRIFTGSLVDLTVEDIQVYREIPLSKITPAMIGALVGSLLILCLTAAIARKE